MANKIFQTNIDVKGSGVFLNALSASNLSGTNTGDQTLAGLGGLPLSGGTMSNTNLVTNLNADLLDGKHYSDITNDIAQAKSTNYGYRYAYHFTMYGAHDKYFPFTIAGGAQELKRDILVQRSYSELHPAEWYTSTHGGGLALKIKANFGGWGGANYSWEIHELEEMYNNTFGGCYITTSYMTFSIMLRGGGVGGATYHVYSDQPIEINHPLNLFGSGLSNSNFPQIFYNSETLRYGNSDTYTWVMPASLTTPNTEDIRIRKFISLTQALDAAKGNWNTAYGWGNHAGLYSLLAHNHTLASLTTRNYSDLQNIPLTFAPSTHTLNSHSSCTLAQLNAMVSDATLISSLDSRLSDARTPLSHVHGNITNTGYLGITASIPLITGVSGIIQAGSFGALAGTFCQGNDSRLSDARTPLAHAHGNITSAGYLGITSGIPLITGTAGIIQAGSFGTTALTFCQGNDSRLSDARPPTTHTLNSHSSCTLAQLNAMISDATLGGTYVHPTGNGNNHIPAGGVAGNILRWSALGTAVWGADTDTDTGVTSLSAIGAVPNANAGTITGRVLNLQPASTSFGGVVTTGTQSFAGAKTFTSTVTATSFLESSLRKLKTNILAFDKSGLDIINSLKIVTYNKKDNLNVNKIGIIIDESPKEVSNEEHTAVDLYKTIFVQAKAIQELSEKLDRLEKLLTNG